MLVGELMLIVLAAATSKGEPARGDCRVPLSSAGRMLVSVLVTVRWGEGAGSSPLRRSDGMFNSDEFAGELMEDEDD